MKFKSIKEALEFAINKEKEAVTFYSELSKKESIADLSTTFRELAQEEANHVKLLTGISKKKAVVEPDELNKVPDLKISDYLVEIEYSEHMPMQDILVLAMKREEKALKLYTNLATSCTDDECTKLFKFLVQEEAKHKLTFEHLYDDYHAGLGN